MVSAEESEVWFGTFDPFSFLFNPEPMPTAVTATEQPSPLVPG
jgi:hypothetical protein